MIEPDGTSWHPSKQAADALKESVRRLYTETYHSWREIPNNIRQTMFNELKTLCTWHPKYNMVIATTFEKKVSSRLSNWLKKARDGEKASTCMPPHVYQDLARKKNWRGLLCDEVFGRYYMKKKKNESNPDQWVEERAEQAYCEYEQHIHELGDSVELTLKLSNQICMKKVVGGSHKGRVYGMGSQNNIRRLQSDLQDIGSSRQARSLMVFR